MRGVQNLKTQRQDTWCFSTILTLQKEQELELWQRQILAKQVMEGREEEDRHRVKAILLRR